MTLEYTAVEDAVRALDVLKQEPAVEGMAVGFLPDPCAIARVVEVGGAGAVRFQLAGGFGMVEKGRERVRRSEWRCSSNCMLVKSKIRSPQKTQNQGSETGIGHPISLACDSSHHQHLLVQ